MFNIGDILEIGKIIGFIEQIEAGTIFVRFFSRNDREEAFFYKEEKFNSASRTMLDTYLMWSIKQLKHDIENKVLQHHKVKIVK